MTKEIYIRLQHLNSELQCKLNQTADVRYSYTYFFEKLEHIYPFVTPNDA